MKFCPTCANMLLFELPTLEYPAKFCCQTCPYTCPLERKVQIKTHSRLVKKPMDPIFSEDDQKNLNKTSGVSCIFCGHGEACFTQLQTRSADEPMTVFYTCTKCKCTWKEN